MIFTALFGGFSTSLMVSGVFKSISSSLKAPVFSMIGIGLLMTIVSMGIILGVGMVVVKVGKGQATFGDVLTALGIGSLPVILVTFVAALFAWMEVAILTALFGIIAMALTLVLGILAITHVFQVKPTGVSILCGTSLTAVGSMIFTYIFCTLLVLSLADSAMSGLSSLFSLF